MLRSQPIITKKTTAVFAAFALCCACSSVPKTREITSAAGLATVSASASSGTGMSGLVTAKFSDPKGAGNITLAGVLVNAIPDGGSSCYVIYTSPGNVLVLVKDSGSGSDVLDLAKGGSISNSQCTLNASQTSIQHEGADLTLNVNLTFKPAAKGLKNIYLYTENKDGEKVGLKAPLGQWTVQ